MAISNGRGRAQYVVHVADCEPFPIAVRGRDDWTIRQLIEAGETGCTPIDNPAPRWSGYVHRLRKMGVPIETIRETHGGDYPGHHARYVLRAVVSRSKREGAHD